MDTRVLTGLRFVAAAVVIIFHFGRDFIGPNLAANGFLTAGPQMVGFFFVLSGFIMTYVYMARPGFHVGEYFAARFARIVPVYLLAFGLLLCFRSFTFWQTVLDLTILKAWFPQFAGWGNYPGWSISVEIFFYAFFPVCLLAIQHYNPGPIRLFVFAILCWLFAQFILTNLYFSDFYKVGGKFSHGLIFYFPISHLSSFLLGISSAYLLANFKRKLQNSKAVGFSFVGLMVVAGLIFWIINHRISDLFGFKILTAAGGLAPLYAVLILLLVISSKFFGRILINRISEFLGEISYALYILQLPVYLAFRSLSPSVFISSPGLAFCVYFIVLLGVSALVFLYFERPVRDKLNSLFRRYADYRRQYSVRGLI